MRFYRAWLALCLGWSIVTPGQAAETRTGEQAPSIRPIVVVAPVGQQFSLPNTATPGANLGTTLDLNANLAATPNEALTALTLPVLQQLAAAPANAAAPTTEQQAARLILELHADQAASPITEKAVAENATKEAKTAVQTLAKIQSDLKEQKAAGAPVEAALERLDAFFEGIKTNATGTATPEQGSQSAWRQRLSRLTPSWLKAKNADAPPPPNTPRQPADVPPGENKLVRWAFLWNFLTIASYTIIGAVKQGMLMHRFGEHIIPLVYMAGAAATGIAVWIYGSYAGKVSRKKLILGTIAALGLSLGAFTGLVAVFGAANAALSFGFSLWSDVFGIMAVTLFWSYANDVFTHDAAKRRFGFIGAAGPLGSIIGSLLTLFGAVRIGLTPLLGAATVLFAATAACFLLMERLPHPKTVAPAPAQPDEKAPERKGILKLIAGSPFLIFLSLVVACERMVPDFSNYLFSAVTHGAYTSAEALTRFSGLFGLWQGALSLGVSLFLTRFLLKKLGVGPALMSSPLANLVGFLVYPFAPSLPWVVGYNGVEGLFRYTWFKTAKEATYTTQDHDVIYRVKAFVEMFLYRFARGIAGVILLLLTGKMFLGLGAVSVAWTGAGLAALWVYAAWRMAREAKKAGA